MSLGPFLGGKRVCVGKTFAENISKCIIPVMLCKFDFEFMNPLHYDKKPLNNYASHEPTVMVKIKPFK